MVVDGTAKFQALKFTFQGLKFPIKSLVLLVRRRIPQKFQALKFQNSGPEIWRFHPLPFHTPHLACLQLGTPLAFSELFRGCHQGFACAYCGSDAGGHLQQHQQGREDRAELKGGVGRKTGSISWMARRFATRIGAIRANRFAGKPGRAPKYRTKGCSRY